MNTTPFTQRLTAGFAAIVASTVTLGTVLFLFANAGEFDPGRQHLRGGAGLAEGHRALQLTANNIGVAPRAGVNDASPLIDLTATL
jgi:hypothetical protein